MSGHSGFQAIGNGYRPPVVPPQVGGTGGVRNAAPSGGAPGAVDEGGLPGEGQPVRADAKSLTGKLDALLLRAAEYSTKAVSAKKIAKAVENVGLPRGERVRLAGLADRAAAFAEGKAKTGPGKLSASQVRRLADADHAKVAGELLRKTNRLEWFDLITGQGDRHGRNDMVDVGEDLTVEVKAIDNDQSFPAYRTGLRTYRLEGAAAGIFLSKTHAVRQTRSLFRRDLFSAIYKKGWLQ